MNRPTSGHGAMSGRRTWTVEQIVAHTKAKGSHFFDKDTMCFFSSRILTTVYQGPGGIYFVTSEQYRSPHGWADPRRYTVRQFVPRLRNPLTRDAGAFNVLTKRQAIRAAKLCALGGKAKIARALGL